MIEIKDEHIKEAETILIGGREFDKFERIPFIKSLESHDLLAVPGSGKTTALLAKLFCLSKNLPFTDGSGILVLSHTNAAVDEIEKHLKPFCPNLFNYPNFIGTVQSFINKCCVAPYYSNLLGYSGLHIDDGLYNFHIEKALLKEYSSEVGYFKNRNKSVFFKSRFWVDINNKTIISDGISPISISLTAPKKWILDGTAEIRTQKVLDFIKNTKIYLLKKGILHYDDCYFIALKYIFKFPEFTELIRKRFAFVFIDEMQDLEGFQIEIIDKMFHSAESKTVLQRIGDINQSIYNSGKKVKVEADWIPRNPMYLNDSNRLTNAVSQIVNCFTLDPQKDESGAPRFVVHGLRKIDPIIKPHLIVFDEDSVTKLEITFSDLITKYSLHTLPESTKYGFKIIGWNAKWDDYEEHKSKLRLENIFPQFKKEAAGSKETFDVLSKYLQLFNRNKKTTEPARNAILNALIAVLRIEDKTFKAKVRGKEVVRYFSRGELINEFKKRVDSSDYELLKSKLFIWSFNLMVNEQFESTYNSVKEFIMNEFKEWFDLTCSQETMNFLGRNFEKVVVEIPKVADSHNSNIKIDIGTVHAAKGQTHCATMYVETSYHGYETEKLVVIDKPATKKRVETYLPNPLLGFEHSYRNDKDKYAKQTLKMMYVGFSRPTHLLCFATLKENTGDDYQPYIDGGWEIVDLTSK